MRTGNCLCGAVQIEIPMDKDDLGVCHCANCQKWAGGPLMEIECGTQVKFSGDENIAIYPSSKWAVRGFCRQCGSHLFIRDEKSGEYGIPPGLFNCHDKLSLNRQVFFDHKPAYYSFTEETVNISSDYIYKHFPQTKENA